MYTKNKKKKKKKANEAEKICPRQSVHNPLHCFNSNAQEWSVFLFYIFLYYCACEKTLFMSSSAEQTERTTRMNVIIIIMWLMHRRAIVEIASLKMHLAEW